MTGNEWEVSLQTAFCQPFAFSEFARFIVNKLPCESETPILDVALASRLKMSGYLFFSCLGKTGQEVQEDAFVTSLCQEVNVMFCFLLGLFSFFFSHFVVATLTRIVLTTIVETRSHTRNAADILS